MVELMKDKSSNVKIKVVEGLVKMSAVLGPKMFNKELIDSFNTLLTENSWRVRQSVYELMGEIGRNFGRVAFAETLEELYLKYMSDKAANVRKIGVEKSGDLADAFGSEWITEKLAPRAFENYHNEEQGYLYRICSLQTFEAVSKHLCASDLTTKFVPLL